jgi:uncharacterized phage-associated protein
MTSAINVAQRFLNLAKADGKQLTNLHLQKLVFFAHGVHLAGFNDVPLIDEPVKAWNFGPVIPHLYEKLRVYGKGTVTDELVPANDLALSDTEDRAIQATWRAYGKHSSSQLVNISHLPGTPWHQVWEENKFGIIPDKVIGDYYRSRVQQKQPAQ